MSSTPRLPKYSQLHGNESYNEIEQPPRSRTVGKIRYAFGATALGLVAFGIILALLLSLSLLIVLILPRMLPNLSLSCDASSSAPSSPGHSGALQAPSGYKAGTAQLCGKSPAEAEAAGCVFDLMTVSWLPLECYDGELTTKFMEEGPWNFYLSNSTRPEALPEERVQIPSLQAISQTTELMWTDRRFHVYHCIYGWKMMHRAIERGWKMESSLATYHHTEHCSDTLANTSVPLNAVITRVEISYPAC
ncbi:hypothetical protein COCSADRAFT_354220 [Bipolaris sorokiniana ND90Pr]|uniref:Ig-like domain-containing protein n=1 Tax=Cochliobolus sativus (strain ND90Pr / ATCC 201652) TaxID=665912 RepID=M2TCA3_COCSN|nr:uncharacterized protein COCSADRAFT_354220 [Bipolaris sorokiniana ND90Pr]EMD66836.1 hypothetical protein COCSADRAFT_354220 [Bipolaris sorokiniana ND90Pr]